MKTKTTPLIDHLNAEAPTEREALTETALDFFTPMFLESVEVLYREREDRDSPRFCMLHYSDPVFKDGKMLGTHNHTYAGTRRVIADRLREMMAWGFEPPFPAGTNQAARERLPQVIAVLVKTADQPGWFPVVRMSGPLSLIVWVPRPKL